MCIERVARACNDHAPPFTAASPLAGLQQHQPSSAQSQLHKRQLEESKRALEYEHSTTSMSLAQEKRTVEKIKRIEAELRQLHGDPAARRFYHAKERERLELQEQLQARRLIACCPSPQSSAANTCLGFELCCSFLT